MKKEKNVAKIFLSNNLGQEEIKNLLLKLSKIYNKDYLLISNLIYKEEFKYKQIASKINVSENYIKATNQELLMIILAYIIIKKERL